MLFLGIDPGLTGGYAVYDPAQGVITSAGNIPTFTLTRNGKVKRSIDIQGLIRAWQVQRAVHPSLHACLEQVSAMPKQGATSMFSFGFSAGVIEAVIAALPLPYTKVVPVKWKKFLSCPADKDGALARASQLMPLSAAFWTPQKGVRTKEDCKGIAEGALLAYYASKTIA
jgi:crossover junction endodeoxyribonuclease RuvC